MVFAKLNTKKELKKEINELKNENNRLKGLIKDLNLDIISMRADFENLKKELIDKINTEGDNGKEKAPSTPQEQYSAWLDSQR